MRDFWVTVEVARGRTRDVRVRARSEWSAAWLQRTLEPDAVVVMVRPVPLSSAPTMESR